MSIVDYSVLVSNTGYGYNPPFKSDETNMHGTSEFPIAVYHADVTDNFVSWHWHEEMEFGFVTEGSVLMECGNERFTLNIGDIYFLNSNTLHALFRSAKEKKSVFRSIVVHGSIIGGKDDSIYHKKYLLPITTNSSLRKMIFTPDDNNYSKLSSHLKNVWNSVNIEVPDYELIVRNELSAVFLILKQLAENDVPVSSNASLVQETRLRDILNFIHAHYAEKITLDDIAAASFISKSEVLRCFKNITGQSPIGYLKNCRLRNAAYMIQNTAYSINTICELCGFDDHSYFSKSFKEVYGCT
ncbi:MAG: AraC family transcriptional regulator, partial [Ruminococcus sp.]|nr:AraC family transcriptional regulator [Ruminococcus sp.]